MTLGGSLFVYNGISQDYCFREAIRSLQGVCDFIAVLDAGSTDGTVEALELMQLADSEAEKEPFELLTCETDEWNNQKGREKLNYFTNKALDYLIRRHGHHLDYHINLQADEVIHEDSIPHIRAAMETGDEGFLTRRHNLWKDPYHQLNVIQSRKPCSTEIIRLAKPSHRSVGDGESLECQPFNIDFLDKIELFHLGYVRDPVIMKSKVIHMTEQVFGMDHDKKLDLSDKFEWDHYFNETDLIPIRKPLPKYVQRWAADRYPNILPPVFR